MEEQQKKLLGQVTVSEEIVNSVDSKVKDIATFKAEIQDYLDNNVTELLDVILYGAIVLDSSDIHIEPEDSDSRLRIRLDGVLQDVTFFDQAASHHLLSRLKLLSKLKLNVTDKPQEGRFTIGIKDALIEIRTSALPAEYGESVVMRILNPKNLIALDNLGLREDVSRVIKKELTKPNGMIIVTGPTGAGKTTTLYAFLKQIQSPEIKVITIEDPIEYHLKGVSQTQVMPEKGYTFSEGLKSIARQDPDVILVGEIRDVETAKIALQAALTGHLVISTLHTNDAAATITRFVDLGAETSSIAPALKMVIAQRLVRRVCKNCVKMVAPSASELKEIKKALEGIDKSIKVPSMDKIKIPQVKEGGCAECNSLGYKGRLGLFEAFVVDNEMERLILTNPPVSSIKDLAVKKGMVTLYQSGVLDVLNGATTLDEIKRVVEPDEDETKE